MGKIKWFRRNFGKLLLCMLFLFMTVSLPAQSVGDQEFYDALKKFELRGKVSVSNLTLKRDRAEMNFTGDFYLAAPINGKVSGAVFIGSGTFKASAPPIAHEREIIRRFVNSDSAESDFKTAVLRFSDDTLDIIGKGIDADAAASRDAQSLATDLEPRLLKETGANISARLLLSFVNQESPGIFFAQFDKGKMGRFNYLVDPQTRIPGSAFNSNSGEKTILFTYSANFFTNDLLIAAPLETEANQEQIAYSDEFDLVDSTKYRMEVDLRFAGRSMQTRKLVTKMEIDFTSLVDNLKAVSMKINEGLSERDNVRRDKAMRIKSAQFEGKDIPFFQEEWESGLTFVIPSAVNEGDDFTVELTLEGDFIDNQNTYQNCLFLRDRESWYPRHGYLKRSQFNILFRHDRNDKVISVGRVVREGNWPDSNDGLTEYSSDFPIAQTTFAAGKFNRYNEKAGTVDLEFYKYAGTSMKESFVFAEFGNVLGFFGQFFGSYTFDVFRGVTHPYRSGQGFATMLLLPTGMDDASRDVFNFLAKETVPQWLGHIVTPRSQRDEWLIEGFADYSGILYTEQRYSARGRKELIEDTRFKLRSQLKTDRGVSAVKAAEAGPLTLGHRLSSSKTPGGDSILSTKGSMVFRMLHYLFTNPQTESPQAFLNMMADFIGRYQFRAATTEDFISIAGEHFSESYFGQMLGLQDLDWFFKQWVSEAKLPSYRMEYSVGAGAGGDVVLRGTLFQDNADADWVMPIPVVCTFGNQKGSFPIVARGAQTDFEVPLPMKPNAVELDPDWWVLSEKTTTKKK